MMQGRRIYPSRTDEKGCQWFKPEAGDYYCDDRGVWSGVTPNGLPGNLDDHEVVEHEDGTITVSPSILVEGGPQQLQWHGYLERGVWRSV